MSAELSVAVTVQRIGDPLRFFDRFADTVWNVASPCIGESRRVGGSFPAGDLRVHGFGLGEGDVALFPGESHIHPLLTDIALDTILPDLRTRFMDGSSGETHAACYCTFPLQVSENRTLRAFRVRHDPTSKWYRHVCYGSIQVIDGWGDVSVRLDPWLATSDAEAAGISTRGFLVSLGRLFEAFLSFMGEFPETHRSVETKSSGSQLRPEVYEAFQAFRIAADTVAARSAGPPK